MATWQFSLHLIPRARLVEVLGDIPACIDPDLWETADLECWGTHGLPEEGTAILDEILPRMQNHWSQTVSAWGSYDRDLVEVSFEGACVERFHVRIDLREVNPRFLPAICQIASLTGCCLLTEDLRVIEPR